MPEIGNKIAKVNVDLVDETFSVSQSGDCHLSIQTEPGRLSFCILNTVINKYVVLRDYALCSADSCDLPGECNSVFENDDLLGLKYKSSAHLWVSPRCTLVPEHLFETGEKDSYLTFNHGSTAGELILQNHIRAAGAYSIFSCPEALMNLLRLHQPNIAFYHQSAPFIRSVFGMPSPDRKGMAVYFYPDCLDIAVVENKKLLFYNTFHITAPEDSVYYLAGVSNLFGINISSVRLLYAGNTGHIPPEAAILRNYVERIVECEPASAVVYSHYITEPFRKDFIHLINLYGCES